jgi:hypothetical protein
VNRHFLITHATVQPSRERIVVAVLAFGAVCRLTQYLVDSSLWCDESFVALNVLGKTFSAMFGPLDWNTASPPGFLVAEKLVVSILGPSEYALRLLPLLAGLAALLLFAPLARRVCGDRPAMLWALIMFAAWPAAIRQAGTLKHFSLDMLLSIILISLALPACETEPKAGRLFVWGAVGVTGLWLSFATLFTFAGCSIVLAARALRRWSARQRTAFASANLAALISLIALSGPASAQRSARLMNYWTGRHAFPEAGGIFGLTLWLARASSAFCGYFWRAPGWILLLIAAAGTASFWHARLRAATMMLIAPILLTIAASFAHLWPFGENQHMSFAAPAMILILGQGCEAVRCWLSQRRRWVGEAALALLLGPVLINSAYRALFPRRNSDLRSVVEFFQRRRLPGDAVVALDAATLDFYTGVDLRHVSPPTAVGDLSPFAIDPSSIPPSARLWVIYNTNVKVRGLDEIVNGRPLFAQAESHGAKACLFGPRSAGQNQAQAGSLPH